MRKTLVLVMATLAVALETVAVATSSHASPACASPGMGGDWPSYGHDLANTRSQPAEHTIGTANAGRLVKRWVFVPNEGGRHANLNSTPTEAGGCVFFGTSAGFVYALNVADGSVVWKTQLPISVAGLGGGVVGDVTIDGDVAYVLANQSADGAGSGPYAVALDMHTGATLWHSAPLDTHKGDYTNASPVVANGVLIAGFSPMESDSTGQGGMDLIDAASGAILDRVYTVPPDRQAQGFSGGGIWTSPAVDAAGFAYAGTGNPDSKTKQDPNTDSIIKVDVRRSSPTFGQIVGTYQGNIDQYTKILQLLADNPICAATAKLFDASPIDDPVCGQLDLDFGAAPNLFTVNGRQVVGDLQKAGVYHAVDTATMTRKWATIVGTPCSFCNASSTADVGGHVYGEATLGGLAFKLNQNNGAINWLSPVLDAIHYQSFSVANGVAYTTDSAGFLDAFNAANGLPLARRPLPLDSGQFVLAVSSTGVSIARNHVFVAVGSASENGISLPPNGYLAAYST